MAGLSFIKSINFKLVFFLLILFVIIFGTYYFVFHSLSEEKNISYMITVAERERMLTEQMYRIAVEIVYLEKNGDAELKQSMEEFQFSFHELMNGSYQLGLLDIKNDEIRKQLEHDVQVWQSLKEKLNLLLQYNTIEYQKKLISEIGIKRNEQIASFELLIKSIENTGSGNFNGLTTEKLILLFVNLLLVIVLFVTWRLFLNIKNSEMKYRLLIDHSPMGIMTIVDESIGFINKEGLKTLGFSRLDGILGKSIYDFIDPKVKQSMKAGKLIEDKCKKIDQSFIDLEMVSVPLDIMGDKGEMLIFKDITEKIQSKNTAENIYKELVNIRSALEISSILEVVDKNGKILYVNDKFCDISKYEAEEVIGKTHRQLKSGHHSPEFYKNLWTTILQGQVWEGQVKNMAKDGSYYWVQTIIVPFINNTGEPYQFIAIRNDITAKKEAEKEINLLATHDHLTHLSNRRKFENELQDAIDRNESVAVIFLDLDRFKYINDSLGHSIGDKLIKSVAKRLKGIVHKDAIVSRQGGDEFTILIKYVSKDCIVNFAKELINQIKQPYIIDQKEILITSSIGISVYPEHGTDIETLLKNADVAMYWSKDNGKDNFSFYENHMNEKSARIMQLELDLRKAVENEEFILYYQPKIELITGEIVGCEALIRWVHPTRGIISPAEFIPLAEETGLINQIGEWALRDACEQNKKWHKAGYSNFVVAVNMSAQQFKQYNIVSLIESILDENELNARFLELEITESMSMFTDEVIIKQLNDLKELGVSIAIDDFGTGYCSMKYLGSFPANTLKIDKCFIDEIGRSDDFSSSLMTNAIISLAKSLKMKVVAEGIEEIEQIHYLKRHNCDIGQGYLISKPLPVCELETKFMSKNEKVYIAV